jgi:hypothetical protein
MDSKWKLAFKTRVISHSVTEKKNGCTLEPRTRTYERGAIILQVKLLEIRPDS